MNRVVTRLCAVALACAAGVAHANTVTLDNGVVGTGHLDITVDDYGSYGRQIGPSDTDNFWPPNYGKADTMSFASENLLFLFIGAQKGAVALSSQSQLWKLIEGNNQATGIAGNMNALGRVVNTAITMSNGIAHSQFTVGDSTVGGILQFDLVQQIVNDTPPASHFEQDYTVTNTGTANVTMIFHALWDMNLYFNQTLNSDDFVGVGNGLCYVYMHEIGSTTQAGALADGGSTQQMPPLKLQFSAYYAGKTGLMPEGTLLPAFTGSASTAVWSRFGMPPTWQNELATSTKNTAGETGYSADGIIGLEYQLTLTAGQTATIRIARHYGTISLPCVGGGVNCGNGLLNAPDEQCDTMGVDTATCNGGTCTTPSCGDGYVNSAAGETCESNGVDSSDCNGTLCTTPTCGDGYLNTAAGEVCDEGMDTASCNLMNCQPPVCGDGIINEAAGEECDGNELCQDCKVQFSVGGGCAGCASTGADGSLLVGAIAFSVLRRRRRARRA